LDCSGSRPSKHLFSVDTPREKLDVSRWKPTYAGQGRASHDPQT